MIENFKTKQEARLVDFAFAEQEGNVVIIEQRFDELDGRKLMKPTREANLVQIDRLIEDNERSLAPFLQRRQDLTDVRAAVEAKLAEGAKLKEKAETGGKK